MTYSVGQILYVSSNTTMSVFPVLVIEEVIRKSIDGNSVSYVVSLGDDNSRVSLDKIDGDVFSTAEDAERALIANASEVISSLVIDAIDRANTLWPKKAATKQLPIEATNDINVVLPDGTVAKVKQI